MKIRNFVGASAVALGMLPPATAADLNLNSVNQYTSQDQVVSVAQFSDVRPTDWAYQALSNLVERYGCVAGYQDSTFRGGQAMTRYEAAALLNACLDRVSETTDEVRKLVDEFSAELSTLRGRVDDLESRVGQVEATQFSTTTKLRGEATFVLGGVPNLVTNTGDYVGNTTFNYDIRLSLDTSFTGKDLLRTRLRSGNFSVDPFGSSASLFKLDKSEVAADQVNIDRMFYRFPVYPGVNATAGPMVRNTEMSWIPSAYRSEILDFFTTAGAPGVYNKATGAGFGLQYVQPGSKGLVAGLNYVSQNGDDSSLGLFNSTGGLNLLAQLGYRAPQWGIAAAYRYGTEGSRPRSFNSSLGYDGSLISGEKSNSVAFNAYWQPAESGIVPSVSAGYGYNAVSGNDPSYNTNSWFVGLQWSDVFAKGNSAGVAYGASPTLSLPGLGVETANLLEVFYKYKVSDNVSITPAIFYVSNNAGFNETSNWGGVIQTKFTF